MTLTRSADAGPENGGSEAVSLKSDLLARARRAQGECDLFVSVHHNDKIPGAAGGDDAAVYYRGMEGDSPCASADVAQSVLSELAAVFHPATARVLPGNYLVLRETDAPAILGEPLYVTLPDRERQLALGAAQRLEAECYFVGIVQYFARGVPRIVSFNLATADAQTPRPDLAWEVSGGDGGRIDPATVSVEVDGNAVLADVSEDTTSGTAHIVARMSSDLANGPHWTILRARNANGNSLYEHREPFAVACSPAAIDLQGVPPVFARSSRTEPLHVHLVARVTDAWMRPVADGVAVTLRAGQTEKNEHVVNCLGGVADAVLEFPRSPKGKISVVAEAGSVQSRCDVACGEPTESWIIGSVVDGATGSPVPGALIRGEGDDEVRSTPFGRFDFRCSQHPSSEVILRASAPGYLESRQHVERSTAEPREAHFQLLPIYGGVLAGKYIFLDCGRGESDTFLLAQEIAARFREAGARVETSDDGEMPWAKVRRATFGGADAYLRVARLSGDRPAITAAHHAGASEGREMGARIAKMFREESGWDVHEVASGDMLSLQMPCPAVVLRISNRPGQSGGERLEESICIVEGVVSALGADAKGFTTLNGTAWVAGAGQTHTGQDGIALFLDSQTPVRLRADWSFRVPWVPSGTHILELRREGQAIGQPVEVVVNPGDSIVAAQVGEKPPVVAVAPPTLIPRAGCLASFLGR